MKINIFDFIAAAVYLLYLLKIFKAKSNWLIKQLFNDALLK